MNIDLVSIPTSVKADPLYEIDTWHCVCMSYRKDGSLLLGTENEGVKLLTPDGEVKELYETEVRVCSVFQHRHNHFLLIEDGDIATAHMCHGDDLTQSTTLFEFEASSIQASNLSVSDEYAVAPIVGEDQLIIYSFLTKQTIIVKPDTSPHALHFLPDGDLLAVSYDGDNLTRYKIEDRQLTVVWTCDEISDASNVGTDSKGLIYVLAPDSSVIYIISSAGKVVDGFGALVVWAQTTNWSCVLINTQLQFVV